VSRPRLCTAVCGRRDLSGGGAGSAGAGAGAAGRPRGSEDGGARELYRDCRGRLCIATGGTGRGGGAAVGGGDRNERTFEPIPHNFSGDGGEPGQGGRGRECADGRVESGGSGGERERAAYRGHRGATEGGWEDQPEPPDALPRPHRPGLPHCHPRQLSGFQAHPPPAALPRGGRAGGPPMLRLALPAVSRGDAVHPPVCGAGHPSADPGESERGAGAPVTGGGGGHGTTGGTRG